MTYFWLNTLSTVGTLGLLWRWPHGIGLWARGSIICPCPRSSMDRAPDFESVDVSSILAEGARHTIQGGTPEWVLNALD